MDALRNLLSSKIRIDLVSEFNLQLLIDNGFNSLEALQLAGKDDLILAGVPRGHALIIYNVFGAGKRPGPIGDRLPLKNSHPASHNRVLVIMAH